MLHRRRLDTLAGLLFALHSSVFAGIHSEGAPGMRGSIRKASYIGGIMEYTIATELGDLFAISMAVDRPLPVGAPVSITLAGHGVVPIAAA